MYVYREERFTIFLEFNFFNIYVHALVFGRITERKIFFSLYLHHYILD